MSRITPQHLRQTLLGLALPLIAAGLTGCEKPAPPPPAPPAVTVAMPENRDAVTHDEFTGRTEAVLAVDVRARVEGFLQTVHVEDSAFVKVGDPLFDIDDRQFRAALDEAKAMLATAEATRQQAIWELEQVEELARRDAANIKEVHDAMTAKALAEAEVEAREAAVDNADLNLGYTRITSPIDGRISRSLVDAGNLVGASERTLLTTIVSIDEVYVYFNIDERLFLEFLTAHEPEDRHRPNTVFAIGLAHEDDFPHAGLLDYVDNTVDSRTGTIEMRGTVPNEEALLFAGLFVRVQGPPRIVENAILVEERAIGTDLGGKYLLVVDENNVVVHRPVKLGKTAEGMRVVREGMTAGDRYIVNGLQKARPGMAVSPQTAGTEPPSEPSE
jgi:RND family efflux transporter MFP subunit